MLSKPDVVLYDWDGTLVDTIEGIRQGINLVRGKFSMPLWSIEEARQNIRKPAREIFPLWFGSRSDEALDIYFDFIARNQLKFLRPMKGAQALLERLSVLGVTQGVVSNKRHDFLQNEIQATGWGHYFSVAIGAGVVEKGKPEPDSILHALRLLPSPARQVWYVGDTETDMQAAGASGCASVFINNLLEETCLANVPNSDLSILDCSDLQQKIEQYFV